MYVCVCGGGGPSSSRFGHRVDEDHSMLTEGTEGWRVEGVEADGEGKKCALCDSKCFCLK